MLGTLRGLHYLLNTFRTQFLMDIFISVIDKEAKMYNSEKTNLFNKWSISRRMDKKAVVHIHNGVLLSHEKEYI